MDFDSVGKRNVNLKLTPESVRSINKKININKKFLMHSNTT